MFTVLHNAVYVSKQTMLVGNSVHGSCVLCTGAIRDSVVRPEALVRHLLWELACQPELAGQLQHNILLS